MTIFALIPFMADVTYFFSISLKGLDNWLTIWQPYVIAIAFLLTGIWNFLANSTAVTAVVDYVILSVVTVISVTFMLSCFVVHTWNLITWEGLDVVFCIDCPSTMNGLRASTNAGYPLTIYG